MRHLLTAGLIVASLTTCAAPIDEDLEDARWSRIAICDPDAISGMEHLELAVDPPMLPSDRAVFDAVTPQVIAGYPCDCSDPRCLADWIDQHLGCGVCAHLRCTGGGMAGACVPCDVLVEEAPCFLPPARQNAPR